MLFEDNTIQIEDSRDELNGKLKKWMQTLEVSQFIKRQTNHGVEVKIRYRIISQVTRFKYIGSTI
ncbi:hypothetical protein Lal_00017263 [Lupinus albus]|nr:hypothetical protein Lal_00017263 [Lupinus albus]